MEEEYFEFEERMARRAMLVERIVRYAVGIAVLYQVLNEIFMVAGKNGYLSIDFVTNLLHFDPGPVIAGLAPTVIFGGYGIYLLKKSG